MPHRLVISLAMDPPRMEISWAKAPFDATTVRTVFSMDSGAERPASFSPTISAQAEAIAATARPRRISGVRASSKTDFAGLRA
jgi:hypothetical protein